MTVAPQTGQYHSSNIICPHCNNALSHDAKFCPNCGEPVNQKIMASQLMPKRSAVSWLWPMIIILSVISAGLVSFTFTNTPLRPAIVFWFLLVCPGMVVVRFLRLNEPIIEWILALALSCAIDAIVAAVQLYAGRWFPIGTFSILIGFSLGGAFVQLVNLSPTFSVAKQQQTLLSRKSGAFLSITLVLLITLLVGGGLWSYEVYLSSHPTFHTVIHLRKTNPASQTKSSCLPASSASNSQSYQHLAKDYTGILYDIPTDVATNISLRDIQQRQENICGILSRIPTNSLHKEKETPINGPFIGSITPGREVLFTIAGQTTSFFDGEIQPDGSMAGTYCRQKTSAGNCGDYGLWSLIPAPSA